MKIFSILLILGICHLSYGQDHAKGTKFISFSIGANFANLLNSEAPHKINIFGSDITPAIVPGAGVEYASDYRDYNTNLIDDIQVGVIVNAGFEYFLKDNLSLSVSAAYEEKGIDMNYRTSYTNQTNPGGATVFHEDTYRVTVRNTYATMPLLIRKYFGKGRAYVAGGIYAAHLLESRSSTYWHEHYYIPNQTEGFSQSELHDRDVRKRFTHHFDYGVAAGGGYSFPVADHVLLNVAVLMSAGLRDIDGKYNNEYEETVIPGTTGFVRLVRSTNYYGFNSNATNISTSLTLGLALKLP